MLSVAIAAVLYLSVRIYKSTGSHVMQHTSGGVPNGNSTSRPVATQPHPPPTTTAFNLPRPEPPASVAVTITQPHMCLTEAPPPTYNLHETFETYNVLPASYLTRAYRGEHLPWI